MAPRDCPGVIFSRALRQLRAGSPGLKFGERGSHADSLAPGVLPPRSAQTFSAACEVLPRYKAKARRPATPLANQESFHHDVVGRAPGRE